MVFVLSTTPQEIYASRAPTFFVVHALVANTVNAQLSSSDPTVTDNYDELLPGQDLAFEDFIGSIWAYAPTGSPSVTVAFVSQTPTGSLKLG